MNHLPKRPVEEANEIMSTILNELNYLIESDEYKIRVAKRLAILHAGALLDRAPMTYAYPYYCQYWTDVIDHLNNF